MCILIIQKIQRLTIIHYDDSVSIVSNIGRWRMIKTLNMLTATATLGNCPRRRFKKYQRIPPMYQLIVCIIRQNSQ